MKNWIAVLAVISSLPLSRGSIALSASSDDLTIHIHDIAVRPEVYQPVLSVKPRDGSIQAVMALFPGGSGAGAFGRTDYGVELNDNFLSRIAFRLAQRNMHVLLFNPPSDHSDGMTDSFRLSGVHIRDVQKAIRVVAEEGKPLVLVGTSRGTLSAASVALGSQLKFDRLVLTATVVRNREFKTLPLARFDGPIQFIHHEADGCASSSPADVQSLANSLSGSAKVELSMVNGGKNEQSDPCRPRTFHGFYGIEEAMMDLISRLGRL